MRPEDDLQKIIDEIRVVREELREELRDAYDTLVRWLFWLFAPIYALFVVELVVLLLKHS